MYVDQGEINTIYPKMVQSVMVFGDEVRPRGQLTKELHPALLEVRNPRRRLVTSYGRPVNVAFALAEVLWILGGRDDVEMLRYYNSNIADYSDDGHSFNAAYGKRLRRSFGHDQLADVVRTLQDDPDSRQATIVLSSPEHDRGWVPGGVLGREVVQHVTRDRACNIAAHLMIRDGALDWYQVIRSNDALWGTPYNWMQWTHVQEYAAAALGVPVGKFIHNADSLHVYDRQFEEAAKISRFDAYDYLDYDHAELTVDGLQWATDFEAHNRSGHADPMPLHVDVDCGEYWRSVTNVLLAYRLYKEGRDGECLEWLVNQGTDPVYGLACARFYYYWRWYKPEHEAVVAAVREEFGADLAEWITRDHA